MNQSIVKDIGQAYNSVYYGTNNIFEDVVNYCYATDIFETLEETEYFANLIIENELAYTFVQDVLEYYAEEQLLEESYIAEVSAGLLKTGMKVAGGLLKKVTPAVRGLPAKTLVKKGYTPGGFSATGKQLGKVNKPALATQTRSIQQARAARKPPEPQKANKYAEMLAQKKASQAAAPVSKPATTKPGAMTPSYVAKRGVTDTLATTLALGMGHMAGLKPATNVLKQFAQPIVRTVKNASTRTAPKGANIAPDPWKQFPKTNKPKQMGIPKPASPKPESTKALTGTQSPKGLLPSAKKSGLSPEGQAIQRLNKMTGGGPLGSRELPKLSPRAPKPAWEAGAKPPKPQQVPGQVQRSVALPSSKTTSSAKPSKKTPEPSTGGKPPSGGGLTNTVRATLSPTEKTGNMRYPGLEKYATGSGPGTGGAKTPKKSNLGPAVAAAGAIAAGASVSQEPSKQNKPSIKTDVYNTMDPSGKIRSRKKVGAAKVGSTFEDAFKFYRKRGDQTFKYAGKDYTTKLAGESVDVFDIVLDGLLAEGYANTYEDALKIMVNLDEAAVTQLLLKLQKLIPKLSPKGTAQARGIIAKQTGKNADLARQKNASIEAEKAGKKYGREDGGEHPSLSARERNPSMR
jgi:hypothetical protein